MDLTLGLLLKIYFGTVVLNVFIAFVQMRERKGHAIQRMNFYIWLAALLEFGLAGIFSELNFLAIVAFAFGMIQSLFLARFAGSLLKVDLPTGRYLKLFAAACVLTVTGQLLGLGFVAVALPVAVAEAWPLLDVFIRVIKRGLWGTLSFVQRFYLVTCVSMGLHLLDYPFLRPIPTLAVVGFSLLYALIHVFSILLPMLANEDVFREYNRTLESEVERKTNMLLNSSKMATLGEMAGGVAHEINTPLAIIGINSDLLIELIDEDPLEKQVILEKLVSSKETVNRIAKITHGLLSFARKGSKTPVQNVNVRDLINDTLVFCVERFKGGGVELRIKEVDPHLAIQVRPIEISQVLLNLLNNAFDAVSGMTEKWAMLEVSRSADRLQIRVTDSGAGIDPQLRERIFSPFFTTKEVGKGTGLGLSISKGIAESHGGALLLDEKSSHTRFILELPGLDVQKFSALEPKA